MMCKKRFSKFVLWALLLVLITACQPEETAVSSLPTPAATAIIPTQPPPTPRPPLPTSLPTQSPTLTPTAMPSPTPTPLILAVLPEWETAVSKIITPPWQLLPHDDPAALLESGQVDAALDWNSSGTLILQRPIALTVPFTMNWDSITQAEADQIIANGHPVVIVQHWSDTMPTRRSLRIDGFSIADPNYPIQERLILAARDAGETAVSQLATQLTQQLTPQTSPVIELAAVGDIMLDRALGTQLQTDITFPFANVAPLLQQADLTLGNVESALGDTGEPAPKSYTFRAPPAAAQSLAHAGFDIVSLANNHALDFGPESLQQGIDLLQANNIIPIGAGPNAAAAHAPATISLNGLEVAVFSYVHVPIEYRGFDTEIWTATESTPGMAWANPDEIEADITAVSADLIIVMLHSGYEYVEAPSPPQMAAARAAIDAGADLVIGHHAHILQGVEFYRDGVIVYGLGNFAFEIDGNPETAVLHAWLDADGVREIAFTPAIIQFGGQPRLATQSEAFAIRQKIYNLSNYLNN
jgi:poly-gamma-glutamate capsule biosynthesis protein CapA/YwtB (metallophosphatase superfamily)